MSELLRCLACDGDGFVDASDLAPGSPERVTRDSRVCRYCNGKGTRPAEARTLPEVPLLKTPWIAGARGYWVAELDPAGLVADPVIRDIKIKSVGKVLLVRHGLGPRGMKQYLMRDGEPVMIWTWEPRILWPEGTVHHASKFAWGSRAGNDQCEACGHAIRNQNNWIPLLLDGPAVRDGLAGTYSLWVGKDCAEKLFGAKIEGEMWEAAPPPRYVLPESRP